VIAAALALGASAAPVREFAAHSADLGVLRGVLERTRVVRTPAGPRLGGYFEALAAAFARWLGRLFESAALGDGVAIAGEIAALAIVAGAVCFFAVSLWRWIGARRRAGAAAVPRLDWRTEDRAGAAALDRAAWRRLLEERLASGDLAGGLEALWWWFAAALDLDGGVDPSWTTRELLRRARRPGLSGAAAALDVLMYGPRIPTPDDVARCLATLERSLA
jgi:hypothetical protein